MPGPPPNPQARHRKGKSGPVRLPMSGREGDPPAWPIGKGSKSVLDLWAQLWSTPQSIVWEELGWTRVVARYTKLAVQAERANATAALLSEVRQLEDRLGLSPMAMKRLMWEIVPEPAEQSDPAEVANLDDYRELYGSESGG